MTWKYPNSKDYLYFSINIALEELKIWIGIVLSMQAREHEFWSSEATYMPDAALYIYNVERKPLKPSGKSSMVYTVVNNRETLLQTMQKFKTEPEVVHWHPYQVNVTHLSSHTWKCPLNVIHKCKHKNTALKKGVKVISL